MVFMWAFLYLYMHRIYLKPAGNPGKTVHHRISKWFHCEIKLFRHDSKSNSDGFHAQRSRRLHHWLTWWSCHESVSGKLDHCPNMTAFCWHISRQTAEVLWEQAVRWPLTLPSLPLGQKSHSAARYFYKTPQKHSLTHSTNDWLVILLEYSFTLS